MLVESITGNIDSFGKDAVSVDPVEIDWQQTVRRAHRLVSRAGEKVDVILPRGERLKHGDILHFDQAANKALVVWLRPVALLAVRAADRKMMGQIAIELGNLHIAAEVDDTTLYTPDDGPAREIADRYGAECESVTRRFNPIAASVVLPVISQRQTVGDRIDYPESKTS